MNRKQIDNLSKLCYDMIKLTIGLTVIGNLISDKFSLLALCIGLISAIGLLFSGYKLDQKEVKKDEPD
ncbi:MAG TPA: hypothetical protein VFF47_00640 [Nitrospirota bacterium]|nr:hypothetical protein [Nitrospirota bacterium]